MRVQPQPCQLGRRRLGEGGQVREDGADRRVALPEASTFGGFGVGEGEAAEAFKAKLGESVNFPKRLGHPEELASMVVECVTNSYMNGETVRVDGGLLAAARPGTVFLDCSTIDVAEAREAAAAAEAAGMRAADAPVSGGQVGAEAGTLAFMVGASDEVYAEVLPLLEVMGARIVHCGAAGLGQAAKICNNMVLGVTQIAVAEAFVLGERLGLQHQALYDVMSKASGQCWSLTTNCPVPGPVPGSPANRDFQPGFAGALMAKDLGLALAALDEQGVAADLGRLAQAKYAEYAAGEGAARDFSGIIEDIRASHTDRSEA